MSVDDSRAVYTDEYLRIEHFFEMFHCAAQDMGIARRVYAHVVSRRINPVNLVDVDTHCFGAIANSETFRKRLQITAGPVQRRFER